MTREEKRKRVLELVGEASLLMVGDEPMDPNRTVEIVDEIMSIFDEKEDEQ